MKDQTIEFEAKMYAYTLNSATKEHGFKADENWTFSLATAEEKLELERKYYPIVFTQVPAKQLFEFSGMVKRILNETPKFQKNPISSFEEPVKNAEYFIAYNPIRVIR